MSHTDGTDLLSDVADYDQLDPVWKDIRKSRHVSFMLSGWLEPQWLEIGDGGTACLAIGCPDDFHAVRLGFPNITADPWRLSKIVGTASSSFNDFVTPTGASSWVPFTVADDSRNPNRILVPDEGPHEVIVQPLRGYNSDAGTHNPPAWTWTGWTPIHSLSPDQGSGLRVLMLRALVPSEQTICYAVGQMRSLLGDTAMNSGFDCFVGGLKFDTNRVDSLAGTETAADWIHNQLTVGSVFPIVQFLTKNPGITGMIVGDSHQQGTSTKEQVSNFLYRAVTRAMPHQAGAVPLGLVNAAQGGLSSVQSFDRMFALLDAVLPSYVVLPGWTYNDVNDGIQADQVSVNNFFARLLTAAEACTMRGIVPIFTTPFPRNAETMGPDQIGPWLWLREQILDLRKSGAAVVDTSKVLSEELRGTYRKQWSSDGSHPNDAGHSELAKFFRFPDFLNY